MFGGVRKLVSAVHPKQICNQPSAVRLRIGDDVRHQTHSHTYTQPVSSLLLASIPSSFFFYDVASAGAVYSGGSFSSLTFSCSRPIVWAALDPPPRQPTHVNETYTHTHRERVRTRRRKKVEKHFKSFSFFLSGRAKWKIKWGGPLHQLVTLPPPFDDGIDARRFFFCFKKKGKKVRTQEWEQMKAAGLTPFILVITSVYPS